MTPAHGDRRVSRRDFLAASAALAAGGRGLAASADPRPSAPQPPAPPPAATPPSAPAPAGVHFFVVGDTHYLADKANPAKLDGRSAAVTARLVDTLNRLPGTAIGDPAGGGTVGPPAGVIHAGDLIDSGDKAGGPHPAMQRTEFDAYVRDFGLTGRDGRLRFPVYEVHGNHDGPAGRGVVPDGIVARNKTRPGVTNVSSNGLHYAWDWGPAHFVCLGIVVGRDPAVARRRRYDPMGSLDFLAADLKANVGDTGRPVVVTHHVDVARYTGPCDPAAAYANHEWDPCDVRAFHAALRPYRVAAVFYGHTHVRSVFKWDGTSAKAAVGLDVYNVDNASHFNSQTQALFYVHLSGDRLTVREYATKDQWATGAWTPQVWATQVAASRA